MSLPILALASLASLGASGVSAYSKNKTLKKLEEEAEADLAATKAEPVGQSATQRELERRLAIDPLRSKARQLIDEGERQVQAAGLTRAADIPGIQSRVAGDLLPLEQRTMLQLAKSNMENDAQEMDEKRQREGAEEAVIKALQAERIGIGPEFASDVAGTAGLIAGSNPEAFTDLQKSRQAFMGQGFDEETANKLSEFAKQNPEAFRAALLSAAGVS
tara:strand:- start:965 stop:1618 length:654 start_codon:yes stop_codon:yes gene_type:complete